MDVQQVRREALARVQARRRPAEYRTVLVGGSETRMQVDRPLAGEFLPAKTAGEWIDDRIVRTPPALGPWVAVLYEIAEAARGGTAAAVKAVRSARSLSAWDQWHLYATLGVWQRDMIADVAPVLRAVLAEWGDEGLGLATDEPSDVPLPVQPEPKRPKVKYRSKWGQPASLAV
jgi:hypothetical protein